MDITTLTNEQLWKLAFEQQEIVTQALAQAQQASANITAIKAEIESRKVDLSNSNPKN